MTSKMKQPLIIEQPIRNDQNKLLNSPRIAIPAILLDFELFAPVQPNRRPQAVSNPKAPNT